MLTPIAKRILIKPVEKASSGIIITTSKPTQFSVVAIGDEVTKVKVGNIIYLDKYSGCEIEHEKEKFLVIEESQILVKVD